MEIFITGIAIAVGVILYALGRIEGKLDALKIVRQSPEGLALNKAVETANFGKGMKLYTTEEIKRELLVIHSRSAFLLDQLDTNGKLLELEQGYANGIKDILTK